MREGRAPIGFPVSEVFVGYWKDGGRSYVFGERGSAHVFDEPPAGDGREKAKVWDYVWAKWSRAA